MMRGDLPATVKRVILNCVQSLDKAIKLPHDL
jgi:hypothetical protein